MNILTSPIISGYFCEIEIDTYDNYYARYFILNINIIIKVVQFDFSPTVLMRMDYF